MPRKKPLEEFQLSLWKLLSSEEEERVGSKSSRLDLYEKEYRRDLEGPERKSTLSALARTIAKAEIVYFGDDHAVPQSRESFLFLLQRVLKHRHRIAIGLEMVHAEDQKHLDHFLAGGMSEQEFLKAVRYWERWGFDWNSYRQILLLAKKKKLPVLALNSQSRGEDALHRRDEKAAVRIADFLGKNPGMRLFVLFGEQHVSESHLPRRVDEALRRESAAECRSVIVHQNSTLEDPHAPESPRLKVLRLSERAYRIVSVSPLAALSSHLDWLDMGGKSPRRSTDREEMRALLLDRVHTVSLALSVLLEQESSALDRFELLLEGESAEALRHAKHAGLGPRQTEQLRWEIEHLPAVLIPGTPYLFLNDTSFPTVCEAAGQLLARGEEPVLPGEDLLLAFCLSAFRHGLGYFTSKLFDPYRTPKSPFAWIGSSSTKDMTDIAAWRAELRMFLRQPQNLSPFLESLHGLSVPLCGAVSRSTGEAFGTKLYRFFSKGQTAPEELRHLYSAASGPGNGLIPGFFGFLRRTDVANR